MDYVQEFIKFLENYKENGEIKYAKKIKEMTEAGERVLVVELADILRYDSKLGIKILNALLSGKDEIMHEILYNVAGLIKVLNKDLAEGFSIRIPNRIEFLKDSDKDLNGEREDFEGYVGIKTKNGEIGIVRLFDDVVEIFLMKYKGKVRVGDLVSGFGTWKKKGGRCFFEVKELRVEKESKMEDLEEIDLGNIALLPENYRERLVDFIEEYKDKNGVRKYKTMIDEMIEKEEMKDIPLAIDELLDFDKELGRPAMKDPNHVLPLYYKVIDVYVKTRFVLKKDLILWAKLKGEKVILKKDFADEMNEVLGTSLTQEKIAELIGGQNKDNEIVIDFKDFVKFLAVFSHYTR